jgi:hypothetical protein
VARRVEVYFARQSSEFKNPSPTKKIKKNKTTEAQLYPLKKKKTGRQRTSPSPSCYEEAHYPFFSWLSQATRSWETSIGTGA